MYKIRYLKVARLDIANIYSYIAIDNPVMALKVYENIKKLVGYLYDFPLIGTKLDNGLMKIVDSKYKYNIIYKINGDTIEIVTIFKNKNFNLL